MKIDDTIQELRRNGPYRSLVHYLREFTVAIYEILKGLNAVVIHNNVNGVLCVDYLLER
eukprot:XP_001709027.1 Hypothetical protein GL50803_113106 [Giardia lamblia ATCC 50803]